MKNLIAGKASILALTAACAVFAFLIGRQFTIAKAATLTDPYGDTVISNVRLCHHNEGSGYTNPTVSINSSGDHAGQPNGHANHDDDIIPPYHWSGGVFAGRNWNITNEAIWNNGCVIPASPSPSPSISPSPSASPSTSPSTSPSISPSPSASPSTSPSPSASPSISPSPSASPTADPCIDRQCPTATPTPVPTPTPSPLVCPDGQHLNNDGTLCLSFELGGPPAGGNGGGQVLGASTTAGGKVLGASTMAGTGSFDQNLYAAIMGIGGTLTSLGFVLRKKASKLA